MVRSRKKGKGFSKIHFVLIGGLLILLLGFLIPLLTWGSAAIKELEAKRNVVAICKALEEYRTTHDSYQKCRRSPENGGTDDIPDPWVDEGTPGTDAFADIGFRPKGSVRYRYSVTRASADNFMVAAVGDLDNNGRTAIYTVRRTSRDYPKPMRSGDRW